MFTYFLVVFTSFEYFLKQLKKWKLYKPDHVCLLMEMEDSFYFGCSRRRLEFDIKWIYRSIVLVSTKCFEISTCSHVYVGSL